MKLGVITDGISRDLEHALKVMNETGIQYGDLQFVWDKEIGDQTPEEVQKIKSLLTQYNVQVPCITRHNFVGMLVMNTEPEDEAYQNQNWPIFGIENATLIVRGFVDDIPPWLSSILPTS